MEAEVAAEADLPGDRMERLTSVLLSPAVKVPALAPAPVQPLRLSDEEVLRVFVDNVPGVEAFRYRGRADDGKTPITPFLVSTYREGLREFQRTDLHEHLLGLYRSVVHHGSDNGRGASRYLLEVAESFMDCQAVQARAIERAGMQIRGLTDDFRGLLARLAGEYKALAVRIYAEEAVSNGTAVDATHYSYRLIADLGDQLGLNLDDVRRAELDSIANRKIPRLSEAQRVAVAARCRSLFDTRAFLKACVSEVTSFCESSPPDSLAAVFLTWSREHLANPHVVLDVDDVMRVVVDDNFFQAVLEHVFLGSPHCSPDAVYRGQRLASLFRGVAEHH